MAGKVVLDKEGFVFIENGEPHLCRVWGMRPWLFSWLNDHWVPMRELTQNEVDQFPQNLSPEAQKAYRDMHKEYEGNYAKASTQRGLPESSGRRYR